MEPPRDAGASVAYGFHLFLFLGEEALVMGRELTSSVGPALPSSSLWQKALCASVHRNVQRRDVYMLQLHVHQVRSWPPSDLGGES